MALLTTIITKEGKRLSFATENYVSGTYVFIEMDGQSEQQAYQVRADKFHFDLRKKAKKNGDTWEGSSEQDIKENVQKFWEENKKYKSGWSK